MVGVRDSEDDDDDGKTKEECEMIARLLDGRWVERKTDRLSSVLPNRESPQFFLFFLLEQTASRSKSVLLLRTLLLLFD